VRRRPGRVQGRKGAEPAGCRAGRVQGRQGAEPAGRRAGRAQSRQGAEPAGRRAGWAQSRQGAEPAGRRAGRAQSRQGAEPAGRRAGRAQSRQGAGPVRCRPKGLVRHCAGFGGRAPWDRRRARPRRGKWQAARPGSGVPPNDPDQGGPCLPLTPGPIPRWCRGVCPSPDNLNSAARPSGSPSEHGQAAPRSRPGAAQEPPRSRPGGSSWRVRRTLSSVRDHRHRRSRSRGAARGRWATAGPRSRHLRRETEVECREPRDRRGAP
jgi:hypothetical protein